MFGVARMFYAQPLMDAPEPAPVREDSELEREAAAPANA